MGLLEKLFGRRDSAPATRTVPCPHTTVAPLWDRAEDIGQEERATAYRCGACRMTFTVEEGRPLAVRVVCLD
ncbi:MAG: hypothetical protein AB7R89_01765 [Dehalococcoidia bacterium]